MVIRWKGFRPWDFCVFCPPIYKWGGLWVVCCSSLMSKMTCQILKPQELREAPFAQFPLSGSLWSALWTKERERNDTHWSAVKLHTSPFNLLCLKPTKTKIEKGPRKGSSVRLLLFRSPRPCVCLPLLLQQAHCVFGFSRRDKSHKQSTLGILQGVQLCPRPLLLNTCPILQAVESVTHTTLSEELFLENSFLERTFFVR